VHPNRLKRPIGRKLLGGGLRGDEIVRRDLKGDQIHLFLPQQFSNWTFTGLMEDEQHGLISALYPPPPPYLKFFTSKNVEKLKELRETKSDEEIHQQVKGTELQFLIPPTKPEGESYRSFGSVWSFKDKFIDLKASGIQQLYPNFISEENDQDEVFSHERLTEMKKMTKSLLLNFLELLGIVAKNPSYANQKIEHIRIILINLHYLLNSYRLHQSREILILEMESKIQQDKAEIENIETVCARIEEKVRTLVKKNVIIVPEKNGMMEVDDEKETDIEAKRQEVIDSLLEEEYIE